MDAAKKRKIIISHSSKDEIHANKLFDLLVFMGIREETIFCTSVPDHGVNINTHIYETIKQQFVEFNPYVIFLLSNNYYSSPICLNEMGATWVTSSRYCSILLPGFTHEQIRGVIDPGFLHITMDDNTAPYALNKLKEEMEILFGVENKKRFSGLWEKRKYEFIEEIRNTTESVYIDLSNCRTFCIGDAESQGCSLVNGQNTHKSVICSVDYSKTKQEICSLVIFPGKHDWRRERGAC